MRVSPAVVLAVVAIVVVGCRDGGMDSDDAEAAAKEFWGYVDEKDTANFCASLTNGSLTAIFDEPDAFKALKTCLKNPLVLDDELAAIGSRFVDQEPSSVTVDGAHATVDYAGADRDLRLFYKEDRGWLVELVP